MGVRILRGEYDGLPGYSAMVDSVSGFVFGPIFDSRADAQEFVDWVRETQGEDTRTYKDGPLEELIGEWRTATMQEP